MTSSSDATKHLNANINQKILHHNIFTKRSRWTFVWKKRMKSDITQKEYQNIIEISTAFIRRLGADTGFNNRKGYTNKRENKTKNPNRELKRTRKENQLLKEAWAVTKMLKQPKS